MEIGEKGGMFCLKTAVLAALLGTLIGGHYFTGTEDWAALQYVYFFVYLAGNLFVLFAALLYATAWPVAKWMKRPGAAAAAAGVIVWLVLVLLTADTFVFQQFRMHVNLAMLEMTLLGGGQIVKFSPTMMVEIAALMLGLAAVAGVIVWCAGRRAMWLGRGAKGMAALLMMGFVAVNLIYAAAFPVNNTTVLAAAQRVPLASPLRMTRFLLKTGVITKEDLEKAKAERVPDVKASSMQYPLSPLVCKEKPDYNIVYLFVDSLRADMLTPEIMPHLWALSQERDVSRFSAYFSGGNCTRSGIFSAFYGIPSSYWQAAVASRTPSILVQALNKKHYEIGAFSSTTLTMPEFDRTVFAGVKGLRIEPKIFSGMDRDQSSIADFKAWTQTVPTGKPFFGFLFLDMVHGTEFPEDAAHLVFKPSLETVDQLKLSADTDPVPYFNRYKNSAHYADENIAAVTDYLKKAGLWEKTILVVSADHGDEFNDNGLNYWGHNGNFTAPQIQVPLVIHWPGREKHDSAVRASSADLVATLVSEGLGCTNPVSDYSTGASLYDDAARREWLHSGSYSQSAFVEKDRIVLINSLGMLDYMDGTTRPLKEKALPPYLGEALEEMSRWYRR